MFGLDIGGLLLAAAAALLLLLLLDLLFAGGCVTGAMASGVSGMMGTPAGWFLLVVLGVVAAWLVAGLPGIGGRGA